MNPAILSFVPHYIASDILQNPHYAPLNSTLRFRAVALFADVSGFTAISEALGKTGKQGTEELTTILNSYFASMIELIQSYGGVIGKFGGDAMTVLFPYQPKQKAAVVRRAISCALQMQARMGRHEAVDTRAGVFGLAMKAGLALGTVLCSSVGDPALRLEYLIAGEVLDQCAEAEHHASKGEVVIHRALLAWAGKIQIAEERENGNFYVITRLARLARPRPLLPLPDQISAQTFDTLAPYLHPSLISLLREGQTSFINEHRKVTVLFVGFGGFDYDHDSAVVSKLQAYLSEVIRLVQHYDGYLNKVDMGDKGSKYLILFGAPLAHENDEERALHCALDLMALAAPDLAALRIGVNSGFVYCGQIGSALRQEYTVMGDVVNLAARLMQAAQPGQILASGFTQRYVPERFNWQDFAPLMVKGKTNPVEVYGVLSGREQVTQSLSAHLQEQNYALPMVGREIELQVVAARLELVQAGKGQIIGLSAEAGMGKSRLSAEIIRLAQASGLSGFAGEGLSYGSSTPYLIWRNLWRSFFGLDSAWTTQQQLDYLTTRPIPGLAQRLPLLGTLLNLVIPDNELTGPMEAGLRKSSLEALLVDCLREKATRQPLLLVLEDCHWLDPLSQDLLEAISRNLADLPVLLVLVYRPVQAEVALQTATSGSHLQIQRISRLANFSPLRLTDFTSAEAERLIALKLAQLFGDKYAQGREVPASLVQRITDKAQGNPFYIDELVNLIQDKAIDPADEEALAMLDLPDSLHNLIISRIDQLVEAEKITLKVASVLGRKFWASWLPQVSPQLGTLDEIELRLRHLSAIELTTIDKPAPELEYIFKHVVTQEVAYESLAFATRAGLHEQVGYFIERSFVENLASYLDLLAYHYGRSSNTAKQREYFRQAGEAAQAAYANAAAVDYYQRLLPLLPPAQQGEILLRLGEVWQLTGKWEEAEAIYRQAITLAQAAGQSQDEARAQSGLGYLLHLKGSYLEALEWLGQARATFEKLDDQPGLSATFGTMGSTYRNLGQMEEAVHYHTRAIILSREIGAQRVTATELGNLGWTYYLLGRLSEAIPCYEQSIALSQSLGDKQLEAKQLGNLGVIYMESGRLTEALDYLQGTLTISQEIGDRRSESQHLGNLGIVCYQLGQVEETFKHFRQSITIGQEIGDKLLESNMLNNLGSAYQETGRIEIALTYYRQALAISREIKNRRIEGNALRNLGEAYQKLGQAEKSINHFQQALVITREIGNKRSEAISLGKLGEVYQSSGQSQVALAIFQQAATIFRELNDKINLGLQFNNIGQVYEQLNDLPKALANWQYTATLLNEVNFPKGQEAQAQIDRLKAKLGQEAFSQLWAESQAEYQQLEQNLLLTV